MFIATLPRVRDRSARLKDERQQPCGGRPGGVFLGPLSPGHGFADGLRGDPQFVGDGFLLSADTRGHQVKDPPLGSGPVPDDVAEEPEDRFGFVGKVGERPFHGHRDAFLDVAEPVHSTPGVEVPDGW